MQKDISNYSYIPILNEEECKEVRDNLYALRSYWIKRSYDTPCNFFTLGVATYLDASESQNVNETYHQRLRLYNSILSEYFGCLLEKIRRSLQEYLNSPVTYTKSFALPGFHIFLAPSLSSIPQSEPHFDRQYHFLPWSNALDRIEPISFTLAINLPKSGGGLDSWEVSQYTLNRAYRCGLVHTIENYLKYVSRKEKIFHSYRIGYLFLHTRVFLHRISATQNLTLEDERITLQGHGVRIKGKWILYW
ncbi:hypothetical protein [Leptothoe spongobia]|uniref:Uncharacterized protein n=1 Tax=Leptothoe spongobia TAU-MAC 1115 TaxID=1967444 RepID=A0A947GKD8_9CYAN|nr:hypothetical protein [Leptothoe spongobia]MBT9317725.1 hypothetical protein [Leptothoe spongobia TAU-MAC 1115]